MKALAPGVWRLAEIPRPTINVYLAEDVLIDAGPHLGPAPDPQADPRSRPVPAGADPCPPRPPGAAKAVCEGRGIPLACHADDVEAMEGRRAVQEAAADNPLNRLIAKLWQGPPHKVDRVLREGDEVAGFRVVHAPGHARGEVIFFRDSDRVAICGDVLRNMSYATTLPGLREPPRIFTYDPA